MNEIVHRWPLITVTMTSNEALAVCGGKRSMVPVAEAGSVAAAARAAAIEVCEGLGKRRCRVEGITDNGVYQMVVDLDQGTLVELHETGGAATAGPRTGSMAAASGGTPSRGRRLDPRRWSKRQAGYALTGVFLLVGVTVPVGASILEDSSSEQVALPAPGPTQLPVAAPAGWSTYARWSAEAEDAVPVRQDAFGRLVMVEGRDVVTRRAETGQEIKRVSAPFAPSALAVWSEDGTARLAVSGAGGRLAVMDQEADQLSEVDMPDRAEAVLDGGEPLIVGADQTAWVMRGNSVHKRLVPAGAEALSADGGAVIAADERTGRIWKITDDSPELPEPANMQAPKGMGVARIPAGYGSLVVVEFEGKDSQRTITVVEVTASAAATEATELVSESVKGSTGAGEPEWDPSGGLVSLGRVAVDFEAVSVTVLDESAEASAGNLWVSGTGRESSARFSRAGTPLDTGDTEGAVPVLITAGGLAVVQHDGQVYAVTETAPTPGSSASPSATTQQGQQSPEPTSTNDQDDRDASASSQEEEK